FLIIGGLDHDQSDSIPAGELDHLRLNRRFHILDWQDEMVKWYAAMDVFVLPSHREGIPRACMEASAMELPVVPTDIRGCREVVKNGESGLLVPVRSPSALADAIEKIICDHNLRHDMGQAGRKHMVEHFTQKQALDRLLRFYAQIAPAEGQL